MLRDTQIPLFLWIATALLVHLLWGGGVDKSAAELRETREVRDFAATVLENVSSYHGPMEIALLADLRESETTLEPEPVPEPEKPTPKPLRSAQAEAKPEPITPPVPVKLKDKEKEKEKEKQKEEEKKEIVITDPKKRIAVRQHVEDKNQKDNPDAELIADEANRVKEQTQARITSTDQNDPNPTPGKNFSGAEQAPGDSEEAELGQSEDKQGDDKRSPSEKSQAERVARAEMSQAAAGQRPPEQSREQRAQRAQDERQRIAKLDRVPDIHYHPRGDYALPERRDARAGQKERKAQARRLPSQRLPATDLLGLGAQGTTANGLNLNLTPNSALAAVGRDRLIKEREQDAERRRAKHRGSWKSLGIERWRSAIENYIPSVKPGNQTALNTARVPFASYLNAIHNRLHPVFAVSFLGSLDSLPNAHPLNRSDMSTNLEIVLSQEDGRLVRMGVTKTSGVTAFDVGALEAVFRSQPFGQPPREIVSPDGNVYFHWEFYRNPYYACSTYFARPFLLKVKPKEAPPATDPPTRPPFRPLGPPEEDRHGQTPRPDAPHKPARGRRPARPDPKRLRSARR